MAKMLPEKIEIHDYNSQISHPCFMWSQSTIESGQIKGTEWLHVCWLIENAMPAKEHILYCQDALPRECGIKGTDGGHGFVYPQTASWQLRARAICKIKGVEP